MEEGWKKEEGRGKEGGTNWGVAADTGATTCCLGTKTLDIDCLGVFFAVDGPVVSLTGSEVATFGGV